MVASRSSMGRSGVLKNAVRVRSVGKEREEEAGGVRRSGRGGVNGPNRQLIEKGMPVGRIAFRSQAVQDRSASPCS